MDNENLSTSFLSIKSKLSLTEYLQQVCSSIIDKTITKKAVEEILKTNGINYSLAKVDFLHLIFEYIKITLEDDILKATEKENIKFLKILFQIHPGDFYFHNKKEIEATISSQLSRIYQDNYINDEEALLKVDLQEIFDLSFDEMNDYSKVEASISIQKGTDPKHLDVFFTNKEYFKLK